MRPVILVVIGVALVGLIRPPHTAWAQATAASSTVLTVGGNGIWGLCVCGDGGAATSASFHGTYGLAVRPDGSIYSSDDFNHRIRAIDPATDIVTTVAGNGTTGDTGNDGPATSAAFSGMVAIAVDLSCNALYIRDIGTL